MTEFWEQDIAGSERLGRMPRRRKLLLLSLLSIASSSSAAVAALLGGGHDVSENGAQLRVDLERTYGHLSRVRELNTGPGRDVSATLRPYLKIGESFQSAEATLRAAGFQIDPYPDVAKLASDPNRATDWFGVTAWIKPLRRLSLGDVSVAVTLMPSRPGAYTFIAGYSARMFISLP